MIVLRRFLIVAAALLVALAIVPALLPSSYHVERAVEIRAAPETIHALVGDLAAWERWTPWRASDPTIETTILVASGPAAHQTWTGKSGDGELMFTASDPRTGIAYDMSFGNDAYASKGAIRYAPADGATVVTWTMDGEADNWFGRYFAAMTDRMVGPMFEEGLASLRTEAEALANEQPGDAAAAVTSPDVPGPPG